MKPSYVEVPRVYPAPLCRADANDTGSQCGEHAGCRVDIAGAVEGMLPVGSSCGEARRGLRPQHEVDAGLGKRRSHPPTGRSAEAQRGTNKCGASTCLTCKSLGHTASIGLRSLGAAWADATLVTVVVPACITCQPRTLHMSCGGAYNSAHDQPSATTLRHGGAPQKSSRRAEGGTLPRGGDAETSP